MGKDAVEEKKYKGFRANKKKQGGVADWTGVPADKIREAIAAAASAGGAIRFGYTGDGGAYAVGLYANGEHSTEFFTPSEDMEAALEDIRQSYEELADDIATGKVAKKGPGQRK